MQLSPAAAPAPTHVRIHVNTPADGTSRWGDERRESLDLDLAGSAPLTASVDVADPYWDGPYAEPDGPEDWRGSRPLDASPARARSVQGLRDAVAALDLVGRTPAGHVGIGYANVFLTFAERPEGLDHLKPFQDHRDQWTVRLTTSVDDLLVDPTLTPIVDAAREVVRTAR